VDDLAPVKSLDAFADRKELLKSFDTLRRDIDRADSIRAVDKFQAQALEIITSPKVREAFDLSKEPPKNMPATVPVATRTRLRRTSTTRGTRSRSSWPGVSLKPGAGRHAAGRRVGPPSGATADIFHALKHIVPLMDRSVSARTDLESVGCSTTSW